MMVLPADMLQDMHEDMNMLFLKYKDRYAIQESNEMLVNATVACSMVDVVNVISEDLLNLAYN